MKTTNHAVVLYGFGRPALMLVLSFITILLSSWQPRDPSPCGRRDRLQRSAYLPAPWTCV